MCVTVGLVGGGESPPPGSWLCMLSPAGWLPRVQDQLRPLTLDYEYGKPLPLPLIHVVIGKRKWNKKYRLQRWSHTRRERVGGWSWSRYQQVILIMNSAVGCRYFSVGPAVTLPPVRHLRPPGSNRLYCLVTESHCVNNNGLTNPRLLMLSQKLNPWPLKSVVSGSALRVAISSSCHDTVAPSSVVGRFLLKARQLGTRC